MLMSRPRLLCAPLGATVEQTADLRAYLFPKLSKHLNLAWAPLGHPVGSSSFSLSWLLFQHGDMRIVVRKMSLSQRLGSSFLSLWRTCCVLLKHKDPVLLVPPFV